MISMIPKSSPKPIDNESESLNVSLSQDDEELLGTEIIPRCVPTPIQKDDRNSPPSKLQDNMSHQNVSEVLYNRETGNFSLSNNSAQKLKVVEDNCNNGSTGSANGTINSVVLNRKLFTNSKSLPSFTTQSDEQPKHPSSATVNLVERTSCILHKLSSLGLITSSDTSDAKGNNKFQHQNHETCTEPFLSLLYSMLEDVSSRYQNHSGQDNKPTEMEIQLIGLLNMFESLLEVYFEMSQEKAILERQCCDLHGNTSAVDSDFLTAVAQQGVDFTSSTSQHQVVQSSQTISLLQQENEVLRRQLMEVDTSQLMELQNQLTNKHIECQKFQQTIQHFEHERKHLSHQCEEKDAVNFRFEKDLIELRNYNEARVKENECLQAENFQLNQSLSNLEERLRQADENVHCSTIARSEVMAKWNDALKERTTLESKIGHLSRELSMIKQQIHFSQSENTHLKHQMEIMENESQERLMEIAAINRERNKVESEVVVLKQSLESIKIENDRLQRDLSASKMNLEANAQKNIELQQIVSGAQCDAASYKNTASDLEMERNAIKALLEDERKKVQKLESDLSTAQTRDAAASEQIRRIVKEKALYVTKLNEANARNHHIERSIVIQGSKSSSTCATPNDKKVGRNMQTTPRVLHPSASNAFLTNQSQRKVNTQEKVVRSTSIDEKRSVLSKDSASATDRENQVPLINGMREISVQKDNSSKQESGKEINSKTMALSNEPTSLLEYLSQDDVPTML